MSKKITEEQLEKIREINSQFMNTKVGIADLEIKKGELIAQLDALQVKFKEIEKELIEEHGQDAVIDLKTGEVKPPEEKKENGKNK